MKESKTVADLITATTETTAVAVRPETLKLKRRLTLDATSIARLKQVVCRVDGDFEDMVMKDLNPDGTRQHAIGIPITDVVTNASYLLICNTLIVSGLKRAGEPLIGKYFAISAGEIKAGKRYRHVDVMELEVAK